MDKMLDWFTTIPGILIICGIILLIIAIILFVVGAKKSKKEVVTNTNSNVGNDTITTSTSDVTTPVEPVTVSPVTPIESTNTVITNDASVSTEPSTNIIEEPIHISEPTTVSIPVEETTNVEPVINIPEMEMPTEVAEVSNTVEENSAIYSGEIPTTNFSVNEEKPVTIYGGNDPLEATQTLPKMEEHHEPYGGNYPEARIVDSVPSVEIPTPVEEVVSAMPMGESVVETSTFEQPTVGISNAEPVEEVTPVVEPISTSQIQAPEVSPDVNIPTPITIPESEEVKPTVEEL